MHTLSDIASALAQCEEWSVSEQGETLVINNEEGLAAFLALAGEQILVEVLLFPVSAVKNQAELDHYILKTHKLFPLSSVGIHEVDGDSYYIAFGALSSQSKLESVVIEVAALFKNVEAFLDLYSAYLEGAES